MSLNSKRIHVGVSLEVRGIPEQDPFLYLSQNGVAMRIGGSIEAQQLMTDLHDAIQALVHIKKYKEATP
jgi:hypothetical protein